MDKKAFIMHPVTWIIASFIIGFIAAVLVAKGIIPIGIPIC